MTRRVQSWRRDVFPFRNTLVHPRFCGFGVAQPVLFCVISYRFVLFLVIIVLLVPRFTSFDYLYGIYSNLSKYAAISRNFKFCNILLKYHLYNMLSKQMLDTLLGILKRLTADGSSVVINTI